MNVSYRDFLRAAAGDRADAFTSAGADAERRTRPENIEKDFWVCLVLDILFNGCPPESKRVLFKGGTSLSKGFGIISRFSEDIDVTVFRDDIGHGVSAQDMEGLSNKQRTRQLSAIKDDCSRYIQTTMSQDVTSRLADIFDSTGTDARRWSLESDVDDPDEQTLLFRYPSVFPAGDEYVRRIVKIESGAKSALEPHIITEITPYVSEALPDFNLGVAGVVTADPRRTFWDKVIIAHGQRQWFEDRGELKGGGLRLTRHYYDLHMLLSSQYGQAALQDMELRDDVVRHARMFFDRKPFGLDKAADGNFTVTPSIEVLPALEEDYRRMSGMIFGEIPIFEDVMASISALQEQLTPGATYRPPAP